MQERSGHIRWNQVANSYLDSLDGPYHANRLDMVRALVQGIEFSDTRCFELGCGDGIFMEWLAAPMLTRRYLPPPQRGCPVWAMDFCCSGKAASPRWERSMPQASTACLPPT